MIVFSVPVQIIEAYMMSSTRSIIQWILTQVQSKYIYFAFVIRPFKMTHYILETPFVSNYIDSNSFDIF